MMRAVHPEGNGAARATTLWRSLGFAWDGLVASARSERNMRIHVVAGILATSFAALAPLEGAERALVVLCAALVVAAEAANTAVEAVVDLAGPPSAPGRLAKDAAAGAVLALAAASVAVFAIAVAGRWEALAAGWRALLPPALAALGLAGVAALALSGARPAAAGVAPLAVAGALLVVALAGSATCLACVPVPAALFAIAVDAARRGIDGRRG